MNPVSSINLPEIKNNNIVITNLYPLKYDPYNTPYESVNWSETYKYYPPNGIQYINPYQRVFPKIDTEQLKKPYVLRKTSTPLTSLSLYKDI